MRHRLHPELLRLDFDKDIEPYRQHVKDTYQFVIRYSLVCADRNYEDLFEAKRETKTYDAACFVPAMADYHRISQKYEEYVSKSRIPLKFVISIELVTYDLFGDVELYAQVINNFRKECASTLSK